MNFLVRLTIVVVLAWPLACQKRPSASVQPPDQTTEETSPSKADETEPAPPEEPPEPAPECRDDRGCTGYLRCTEGQCAVPPAVEGREVEGMPEVVFRKGDEVIARFKVELAVEPWERTRGLMHRRKMHPDFGMLFVFSDERVRSFWMKNTIISLDMVHIDAHGEVVGIVHSAEPMTLSPRRTGEPARYVLELNAGTAKKAGIEEGTTMSLQNAAEDLRPR